MSDDHFNKSSYNAPNTGCVMTVHFLDRLTISVFLGFKDVVYKLQPYTWRNELFHSQPVKDVMAKKVSPGKNTFRLFSRFCQSA